MKNYMYITIIVLCFFANIGLAVAHEKHDPDPDPCLHLAIPYDFCLQTIGKEWWERQVKNAPPSIESRIKELEKRIKELEAKAKA
tara:strand:+ start:2103 stop:2357 length:255 start_codon:yes stop_codon:yes gene_type:complete